MTKVYGGMSVSDCTHAAICGLKGRWEAGDIVVEREHCREVWRLDDARELPEYYEGKSPVLVEARFRRVSIALA